MDAQFLDAARIGLQHLELDAARVAHKLAARRDAAGKREYQAADRVELLFLLRRGELYAEMPLQHLDRRARIGDEAETRILADHRFLGDVMLVLDLAHDFLDQVLDGNEAVGPAIFVDDQRQVPPRQLHAEQEIEHRH